MAILWIVAVGLLAVVPVLLFLLKGVLGAAKNIEKTVDAISGVAATHRRISTRSSTSWRRRA